MNFSKVRLVQLIRNIDDLRSEALLKIYHDHNAAFHVAKGAKSKHHVWEGGYADHIAECLRINEITYYGITSYLRETGFSQASAAIALFFHDIEKLFRYDVQYSFASDKWRERQKETNCTWESLKWEILEELQQTYAFKLTEAEMLAIKYCHGEGDDYDPDKLVASPLAAHVHNCDYASARMFPQQGKGTA